MEEGGREGEVELFNGATLVREASAAASAFVPQLNEKGLKWITSFFEGEQPLRSISFSPKRHSGISSEVARLALESPALAVTPRDFDYFPIAAAALRHIHSS